MKRRPSLDRVSVTDQRLVRGVVGRLPLQHRLGLLRSHPVEVPGGQPLVGDHFDHREVGRGSQEGRHGSNLDARAEPWHALNPGGAFPKKKEEPPTRVETHQEQVLLVALHPHREAEGRRAELARAAVQIQEGGGVEDAIRLHTHDSGGVKAAGRSPQRWGPRPDFPT